MDIYFIKKMSNKIKINLLFICFIFLFTSTLNKEIFQEWEDNTQNFIEKDITEDLLSYTISYSSNGASNTKMYLGKQNIYLIKENENIKIPHNIKSINSALIESNEKYYFCSSSALYKIENKEISEIKISKPNDFTGTVKSYKCIFHRKKDNFLIGMLGSNFMFYFDSKSEKITSYKKVEGHLNDIGYYMDGNALLISTLSNIDNKEFYLQVFKFENDQFIHADDSFLNSISDFSLKDKTIKIGFLNNQIILLFSYANDEFNFYHYNIYSKKVELVGGKNILTNLKNCNFINANFMADTPFIYYQISRNNRYYLGVADLKYFIILYNIELFNDKEIIFDENSYYNLNVFFYYFEKNIQKTICPFVMNSDFSSCQYTIENKYFVISRTSSLYRNYFSDFCSNGQKLGNYCLEDCPIYSSPSGKGDCSQCGYNVFYNYAEKSCSGNCEYESENKICYDCVKQNKIFDDHNCVDSCSEVYKIFDKNSNKCISCNGKYFNTYDNTCVDKCPSNYEIDEKNKICINCESKLSLTISGKTYCYKKCPPYYRQVSSKCESCPSGLFYKNGECVESCGDSKFEAKTTIKGVEIKYCLSCKDFQEFESKEGKCIENCGDLYEENGFCVEKCREGYEAIEYNRKCESCLNKGRYYYDGKCVNNCTEIDLFLAWNETDNICKFCTDISNDLFFEDNRCVKNCKETAKKSATGNICFTCKPNERFYSNGGCYATCPNYTIPNKLEDYCYYCSDDTNFYKYKCLKKCEEPYVTTLVNNHHQICEKCPEKTYYTSQSCRDECEIGTYFSDEDRTCHLCFCNSKGSCKDNSTNICNCALDFFGASCEFYRKGNDEERILTIIPINKESLKTNNTYFTFNIKDDIKYKEIKWQFYVNSPNNELTSNPEYKNFFVTGNKEEIFGINPNLLEEGKENRLSLTLKGDGKDYNDNILISAQKLNIKLDYKASILDPKLQDSGKLYIPMNTTVEIEDTEYTNYGQYKYYYQFAFIDDNNEEIPLSNYSSPRSILTYYIPFAKQYIVNIKNDKGDLIKIEIKKDNSDIYKNYNNGDLNTKSVDQILNDNFYNDIEKIFIFLIVFKSNGKVLQQNDINKLFKYINNSYTNFINENGYYLINDTNSHLINYAEPKVLFSLINSIIINHRNYMDFEKIEVIFYSLKKCVDLLNKNNANEAKLSSSDIKSLLRTIEQLHDVYNEQINTENAKNKNNINLSEFYNLFNKINNFLSSKLYPGEGIKIIGNRTLLFSYHFGNFQDLLAISSNNLTSPANISNISSYSYEDYGLNEGICGKNGETFLCINNNIYNDIKNKIIEPKNYALNIFIVNNIKKSETSESKKSNNIENENDNYLVHFQLYNLGNKTSIDNITTNKNLNYSLEFSYKNEKKRVNDQDSNDSNSLFYMPYNYSNIVCYPKNYKEDKEYYCFTYFDYKLNIIQCKCNIINEILIVENPELANFYKSLQFQSVQYTYTNGVTKQFIIFFLIILLIPGLLFLLFDIFKINKNIRSETKYDFKEKRRDYYQQVKKYTNSTITFPIYLVFNVFPYCAAFNATHYSSPKFIKHLIVVTALLLGFIINLLPFLVRMPFKEKQLLIDKRDIRIEENEIHSMKFIKNYLVIGFIIAIISLICVHFFIKLFNKILKINEKKESYLKNIKDIFKDFIYFEIKKNRYLGKNFGRIKNRMKAFYAVCGRYLLNKNIMNHPDRNKKFENYIKYTGKMHKVNLSITNNRIEVNDQSKNNINNKSKESLIYELPENNDMISDSKDNIINTDYKPPSMKINARFNVSINQNAQVISSYGGDKPIEIKTIVKKIKPKKCDNFQINGIIDNKCGVSKNTICRFEKIKNRYINSNRIIENVIPKQKENASGPSPLCIYRNNNLSIYNVEDYIKCNENSSSSTGKDFGLLFIMTIVLGIIFFFLLLLSVIIIKKLMDEFEYFMVKTWLLCTISILIVLYFLIYLIKALIASILLFNFYSRRHNGCLIKFMFKAFVDKNIIYIFKIRNYITKYRREFINI
jgi:hypothetical protein